MKYTFKGKNIVVSDSLKSSVEEKMSRLSRILPDTTEINVLFYVEKPSNKIEVTAKLPKRVLRAEVISDDMYSAIDQIVDKLERQMLKYKDRLRHKSRKDSSFEAELQDFYGNEYDDEIYNQFNIEKFKKFQIKPMDFEEAILEMELLSHNFFVFINSKTNDVNVVYKRQNGSYGIIEPE